MEAKSKLTRRSTQKAFFNGSHGMESVNALKITPENFGETWGTLDDVIMGGNSKS